MADPATFLTFNSVQVSNLRILTWSWLLISQCRLRLSSVLYPMSLYYFVTNFEVKIKMNGTAFVNVSYPLLENKLFNMVLRVH